MKRWMMSIVLLAANALVGPARTAARETPFFCDLSALTKAERAHKEEIGLALAARRLAVHELRDAYEFVFPGDRSTFRLLADWTETERLCCPFFDFDLQLGREGGQIVLRLSGREGTKAFVKADFERWLK